MNPLNNDGVLPNPNQVLANSTNVWNVGRQFKLHQSQLLNQPQLPTYHNSPIIPQMMPIYNITSPRAFYPCIPSFGNTFHGFGLNFPLNKAQTTMQQRLPPHPRFSEFGQLRYYTPFTASFPNQHVPPPNETISMPFTPLQENKNSFVMIKCDYCPKKVMKYRMDEHRYRCGLLRPHACLFCTKRFEKRHGLKQHVLRHKDKYGQVCHRCLKTVEQLQKAVYNDHHPTRPTTKCFDCIQFEKVCRRS